MKKYNLYINIDGAKEYLYAKDLSKKRALQLRNRLSSFKGYSARLEEIEFLTDAERQLKLLAESIHNG